jgi:hypothetical protein
MNWEAISDKWAPTARANRIGLPATAAKKRRTACLQNRSARQAVQQFTWPYDGLTAELDKENWPFDGSREMLDLFGS